MDAIAAILAAYDDNAWRQVPVKVAALVKQSVERALDATLAHTKCAGPVYLNTATGQSLADVSHPGGDYVLVKAADRDYLAPVANAFSAIQKPLGGPTPLTAAITGGVLAGGLGYGTGSLLEHVLPVERGKLRKTLGLVGAGLGATPGLMVGGAGMANPDQTGGGLKAWTSKWPFSGPHIDLDLDGTPRDKLSADAGAIYLPTIPVDAFNNAVWSDVRPPNPFGTKSPWGDDDQPLGTSPLAAAAVSGLVAGAGAATGQQMISPWQIGIAAGLAGGKGYLAGLAAGKTLGALAGLSQPAQRALQQIGLWGGLVSGVANSIFG